MGHKVVVFTAAMNLNEAGGEPTDDAIIASIIGNRDLPDELLTSMFQGSGAKMVSAYNYARDHYTLALPSGNTGVRNILDTDLIASVIVKDVPHPDGVKIISAFSSDMDFEFAVLPFLLQYRGYNVVTKEITILPPGLPVPQPECIEWSEHGNTCLEWTDPRIRVYLESVTDYGDGYYANINYGIFDTATQDLIDSYQEIVPYVYLNVVWGTPYIFAQYNALSPTGDVLPEILFWLYEAASEKYPELAGEIRNLAYDTYLPVVPIRYENHDLTQGKYRERDLYKTSKRLLDKLAIDIDLLAERLNENPDIDEMDHAYVMFGVNLQTQVPESLWYVGDFLSSLHVNMQSDEDDFLDALNDSSAVSTPINYYSIGEGTSIIENGLNLSFIYDYIKIQYLPKVVGRIGEATKHFSKKRIYWGDTHDSDPFGLLDYDQGVLRIDMQITDTMVKRVTVYGWYCTNLIYHKHSISTNTMHVADDSDNNNFIVPVLFRLSQAIPLRRRNKLYNDATMLVINCYDKIKVKWYQKGIFKIVLVIAVIVIIAWSGQAWVAELATALAAGAYSTILMQLALTAIAGIMMKFAFNMIVKELGTKWAMYAAIAFTVIAIGLQLNGPSTFSMLGTQMTTSQGMLQVSSGLISSSNEFLAKEAEQYVDEYAAFTDAMDTRWEELEAAQDLLNNKGDVDPLLFAQTARLRMVPSEDPTEFYVRCLELPSYSTYGIHQEIPGFCDRKLFLEKDLPMDLYNQNLHG